MKALLEYYKFILFRAINKNKFNSTVMKNKH